MLPACFGKAQWIAADHATSAAPLLRIEFSAPANTARATLHLCGLGYHEAWINGRRVGDHVLDPAQTDYEKRVLYVSWDVTAWLRTGPNALGVMLGNGFYHQDRVWGEGGLSYGRPRLLASLQLRGGDGCESALVSDRRWRCAAGPVQENNVYAGEVYDARREAVGWTEPGFDDADWHAAVLAEPPGGRLERQTMPPVRVIETLRPVAVEARGAGRHIVDMGRNFSGWARLRVAASRGTVIQLRFAETLAADGELDTASTGVFATGVEQTDRYVCKGGGAEIWEPRFTFHGFRYVEVAGWPGALRADDMTGVVVHTDLPTAGSFECSDERLNQLHRMALWTHRSNLHGIPEDCPARERCGWLGDVNMIAEFSMWNFEGRAFWRKYLDDIETTRDIHDGTLCNIAPGRRSCGKARPDWAATLILLPWYLYVQYGDEAALSKHWASMRHLIESFGADARAWILGGGYGDWFDPGAESICSHTDPALTTTFWFYRCAETMSRVAAVLLREAERRRYADWALRIRDAVQAAFYRPAAGSFGSQTADAMALEFGLAPQGEESRVLDALVRDIRGRDIRLNTGVMGVRFLFEALTRRGQGDLALALMRRNGYPSFGDLIQRGATTLWESWGEAEHDRKHGARSLNHPMMAGYDNWFFNTLAGIRPDADAPGFRRFILAPHPVPGLQWVRCRYRCAAGEIVSDWQCDEREFTWRVVAPPGTTALAYPPGTHEPRRLEAGEHRIAKKMRSP
jgi:alpha-L-rhamnosidase